MRVESVARGNSADVTRQREQERRAEEMRQAQQAQLQEMRQQQQDQMARATRAPDATTTVPTNRVLTIDKAEPVALHPDSRSRNMGKLEAAFWEVINAHPEWNPPTHENAQLLQAEMRSMGFHATAEPHWTNNLFKDKFVINGIAFDVVNGAQGDNPKWQFILHGQGGPAARETPAPQAKAERSILSEYPMPNLLKDFILAILFGNFAPTLENLDKLAEKLEAQGHEVAKIPGHPGKLKIDGEVYELLTGLDGDNPQWAVDGQTLEQIVAEKAGTPVALEGFGKANAGPKIAHANLGATSTS